MVPYKPLRSHLVATETAVGSVTSSLAISNICLETENPLTTMLLYYPLTSVANPLDAIANARQSKLITYICAPVL